MWVRDPSPLRGEGVSRGLTDEGAFSASRRPAVRLLRRPPHTSGCAAHLPPRGEGSLMLKEYDIVVLG